MRKLLVLLVLCCSLAGAAGTIQEYPKGGQYMAAKLAKTRKDSLVASATGPLKSVHLRYFDVWKGRKRTFLWSAQSYRQADGRMSYVVVLGEVALSSIPKVSDEVAFASESLTTYMDGSDTPLESLDVVCKAIDRYVVEHKIQDRLQP